MLLFDHNLSPRLVRRLNDIARGSAHVSMLGLDQASDDAVWSHARDHQFTIVTKDADFDDLVTLRGFPPKLVRLIIGNCTTNQVEELLRQLRMLIEVFITDPDTGLLLIRAD
jgi:predicted nuclease of predicted toxin-antitoxin system